MIGVIALVWGRIALEHLVRFQFEHHPDAWQADGCPRVSFWRPNESASYLAGKRFAGRLMFRTPAWVQQLSCRIWIQTYRVTSWVWIVVVVTVFSYLFSL